MKNSLFILLLAISLAGILAEPSTSQMISNLEKSSSYSSKKSTLVIIAKVLFEKGYEASFVAGILGNIYHEGAIGKFESSAYISHPEAEPQYLKYMDQLYNYRSKYSNKIITEVSMHELSSLLEKLKSAGWKNI